MRLKFIRDRHITVTLLFIVVIICYLIFLILVSSFWGFRTTVEFSSAKSLRKLQQENITELITIIIREFEPHENDVTLTVQSFLNIFPTIQIFILYDELPYPPLDIMLTNNTPPNVMFFNLMPRLKINFFDYHPIGQIKTKYVLFLPDSTRITSRQSLQIMLDELIKYPKGIVTTPVNNYRRNISCLRTNVNSRQWTLKYSLINGLECDGILGKHVILVETETLKLLSDVFLLPFPYSIYIQTASIGLKIKIIKGLTFHEGKPVPRSHHFQWKQKQINSIRLKKLYNLFKIKQVIRETGTTEWYGCSKETVRCFGPVLESMPSYLFEEKWTPPCCLSNLKKTARHVFNTLDSFGIRYWLEAGSLLGAMRTGDILPWDHDVDVGFITGDLQRCTWLKKAKDRPVLDTNGFLWEKATEGNFYRVYFSRSNKIHVKLFPFYTKNGTMVRDSWFTHHKNMEFPENFLHPMSSINFIGRSVPCPNNIRDFLELKFGKGAIENPEYPDPNKKSFP